jgi:hypothetical protein
MQDEVGRISRRSLLLAVPAGLAAAQARAQGAKPMLKARDWAGPQFIALGAAGATAGTPEIYFGDPDGIPIRLQDVSYCGGSGYLGNVCA